MRSTKNWKETWSIIRQQTTRLFQGSSSYVFGRKSLLGTQLSNMNLTLLVRVPWKEICGLALVLWKSIITPKQCFPKVFMSLHTQKVTVLLRCTGIISQGCTGPRGVASDFRSAGLLHLATRRWLLTMCLLTLLGKLWPDHPNEPSSPFRNSLPAWKRIQTSAFFLQPSCV